MNKGTTIRIKAVGDICPGDKYILGLGVLEKTRKYGVEFIFEKVKNELKEGDLVVGNLEGLLTKKVENLGSKNIPLSFCGLPKFANALASVGFNVINIANNHSFEHGPEIFFETVRLLESAGISVCGLRDESKEYYCRPIIMKKKGKILGILSYNWVGVNRFLNSNEYLAESHDGIVNYTWNRERFTKEIKGLNHANSRVSKDIKKLKKNVEFLILLAHWGYEFSYYPPYSLTLEARKLMEYGADLIIGCHPHVIQGMVQKNKKAAFYSLGNFVFDSRNIRTRETMILDLGIDLKNNIDFRILPIFINRNFQPKIAAKSIRKKIEKIFFYSSYVLKQENRVIKLNDNRIYKQYEYFYKKYKIKKIFHYIIAIKNKPLIMRVIIKKIYNLSNILWLRLHGKKIRW